MADASWPSSLPTGFEVRGFSYGLKGNVVGSQPETGRVRLRRRSTARVFLVSGSMLLERDKGGVDQVEAWLEFLHETLADGSLPFDWVDPMNPPPRYRTALYREQDANAEFQVISSTDLSRMLSSIPRLASRAVRLQLHDGEDALMPNAVSDALKRAIYSGSTERVFIMLVQITHARLVEPIRLSTDGQDTRHGGKVYQSFPFKVTLPDDKERSLPTAQLVIPNIDLSIVELIRSVDSPADVRMFLVLDGDTEKIERGPWDLKLQNVTYDIESIRATLSPVSLLSEPLPAYTFNTIDYPGL